MSIKNAFKLLFNLKGADYEIIDLNGPLTVQIKAAPSNYFRNLAGPEESIVEGEEFVIDIDMLATFGTPKRGHRLRDIANDQTKMISSVIPMHGLKGELYGYRVRTS